MIKTILITLLLLGTNSHASLSTSQEDLNRNGSSSSSTYSLWQNHPDWDEASLSVIRARKIDLEKGADLATFCPGYNSASNGEKEGCLLRLVSAIVKLESNFKPGEYYVEDKGYPSVGLMQLSKGECPNAKTDLELKNPIENLKCGINKLADNVKRGECYSCKKGGGAYWSTLRASYTYRTRSGKILHLGKGEQIASLTSDYREGYSTASPGEVISVASVEASSEPISNAESAYTPEPEKTNPLDGKLWNSNWRPKSL